jgi:hypothetical protein
MIDLSGIGRGPRDMRGFRGTIGSIVDTQYGLGVSRRAPSAGVFNTVAKRFLS